MDSNNRVTIRLTQYMARANSAELPHPVIRKAKHHILDTLAAMISGSQLKPGRAAIAYAEKQGGPPEAQVVAGRVRVSAINAALANGMLAHSEPMVLAFKKPVTLVGDPELSRHLPERHAIVTVATRDGRTFQKKLATFRCKSDNPLSTEEVEKKASDLLEPVLGTQRSRQLIDAVGRLETLPSIRELLRLLVAKPDEN